MREHACAVESVHLSVGINTPNCDNATLKDRERDMSEEEKERGKEAERERNGKREIEREREVSSYTLAAA